MSIQAEPFNELKGFCDLVLKNKSFGKGFTKYGMLFVPVFNKNLNMYPNEYSMLSDAVKLGTVEMKDFGNHISSVGCQNNGQEPILIKKGELLVGRGTQNRTVIGTTFVETNEMVKLPVKCVHSHHRLSKGARFTTGCPISRKIGKGWHGDSYRHALASKGVRNLNQTAVWSSVRSETRKETMSDKEDYVKAVKLKENRIKGKIEDIKFPDYTIGVLVFDNSGKLLAGEVYSSATAFKSSIFDLLLSLDEDLYYERHVDNHLVSDEIAVMFFTELGTVPDSGMIRQVDADTILFKSGKYFGELLSYHGIVYLSVDERGDEPPKKEIKKTQVDLIELSDIARITKGGTKSGRKKSKKPLGWHKFTKKYSKGWIGESPRHKMATKKSKTLDLEKLFD
jgi:hypothetical protein